MKIICIGRNYADHAKELNNPLPKVPLFFLKPDTALIKKNGPFFIPEHSQEVHHELELVIRINRIGKHIASRYAHKYFDEITLGLDFTARDVQQQCKEKGHPWEIAKAFDGSAPVGKFVSKSQFEDLNKLTFKLHKNGEIVQDGNTKDLIFSIDELIAYVSRFFTLKIGDLIYTGTPAGVGPVKGGDVLVGKLEGEELIRCKVI